MAQRFRGFLCNYSSSPHPLNGAFNQNGRLSRGFRRLSGEVTDLLGYDCEASAVLPGSGCFHRGVERQNIGLECDVLNDFDDLSDVIGGRADFIHASHLRSNRFHGGLYARWAWPASAGFGGFAAAF